MNGKTTLIDKELQEEIYIKQLEGFVVPGKLKIVCELVMSHYGSTQTAT